MHLPRPAHVRHLDAVDFKHVAVVERETEPHKEADTVVAQDLPRTVDQPDREPRRVTRPERCVDRRKQLRGEAL